MLVSSNERIRFIRWIDMENVERDSTQHEHQEILQALTARDAALSERLLSGHIALRRDQIVDAIARGLARIYLPQEQAPAPAAPCGPGRISSPWSAARRVPSSPSTPARGRC